MVGLEHCLKFLGKDTKNEEKILGLMGLCRFLDPHQPKVLHQIFEAMDFNYLRKLLTSKAKDHLDYNSVAVNILGTFAAIPELAESKRMKAMVPFILSALKHHQEKTLFQDTINLLEWLSCYPTMAEEILTSHESPVLITTLVFLENNQETKNNAPSHPLLYPLFNSLLSNVPPATPCPTHFVNSLLASLEPHCPSVVTCLGTVLMYFPAWIPLSTIETMAAWLRQPSLPPIFLHPLLIALSQCSEFPLSAIPVLLAHTSIELQLSLEVNEETALEELVEVVDKEEEEEKEKRLCHDPRRSMLVASCCHVTETCVHQLLTSAAAATLDVSSPILQIRNTVLSHLLSLDPLENDLTQPVVQALVRLAALLVSEIDDNDVSLNSIFPLFLSLLQGYPETYAPFLANTLYQWGCLDLPQLEQLIQQGDDPS